MQACIHYIIWHSRYQIPGRLEIMLHGQIHNELVHRELLYIAESNNDNIKYVLVIKEDLRSYASLHICSSADSGLAKIALSR